MCCLLTWNDSQQVVPAAFDAASMSVNELSEADTELFLHCARPVDMAADAVQLGAVVVLAAKLCEPLWAPSQDGGGYSHSLHICDCGGAAVQAHIGWEGWLESGLALLALERFNQSCLLACQSSATPSAQGRHLFL